MLGCFLLVFVGFGPFPGWDGLLGILAVSWGLGGLDFDFWGGLFSFLAIFGPFSGWDEFLGTLAVSWGLGGLDFVC